MADRMEYKLVYNGQVSRIYTLTDDDVEWLARSIWGEESERPTRDGAGAVAWTMFNRFMRWPPVGKWTRFKDLIRAFSQPVNPKWAVAGAGLCATYPEYCDPDLIERRRHITYDPIPFAPKEFAVAFAEGNLLNPLDGTGIVDFNSCKQAKTGAISIPGTKNCFYRDTDTSMKWLPGEAQTGKTVPPSYLKGIVFSLLIGLGLYKLGRYLYRRRKLKKGKAG